MIKLLGLIEDLCSVRFCVRLVYLGLVVPSTNATGWRRAKNSELQVEDACFYIAKQGRCTSRHEPNPRRQPSRAESSTKMTGHATSYEWTHAARILAGETRWSRGRPGGMLPQESCVAAATCLLTHLLASVECCCNIWPKHFVVFYCNYRTQLIFNHFLFAH